MAACISTFICSYLRSSPSVVLQIQSVSAKDGSGLSLLEFPIFE